jgi:transketolase
MAESQLAKKFSSLINYHTYVVSGDGCMMEGITSEAASFAGHNQLGKLICFYDSNSITIEGSTDKAFSHVWQQSPVMWELPFQSRTYK